MSRRERPEVERMPIACSQQKDRFSASLMARHGVWQLQKLTLSYCEFSGSSRGARLPISRSLRLLQHFCPLERDL